MGDGILESIFTVDSVIAVTFLVYMVTSWISARDRAQKAYELNTMSEKLAHERIVNRDQQFTDTQSAMIELLRVCQQEKMNNERAGGDGGK